MMVMRVRDNRDTQKTPQNDRQSGKEMRGYFVPWSRLHAFSEHFLPRMILRNVENQLMTPPKHLLTWEIDLKQCQGRYLTNMVGDKNKLAISDHLRSDHDLYS